MNVTALLAHPDDELMCAGTLAKFVDGGHNVTLITVFSDQRGAELHESAKILGVQLVELTAPQLTFGWTQESVIKYDAYVSDTQPDLILSHRIADTNTSHTPLAQICRTIARRNNVSLWEVDTPIPGGIDTDGHANNLLVDITDQIDRKCNAVDCYKSNAVQYPRIRVAFETRDLHNGMLLHLDSTDHHYAEALRVVKAVWR